MTPNRSEWSWSRSSGKIWNSASSSSCNFFGSAEISAALNSLKMIWNMGLVKPLKRPTTTRSNTLQRVNPLTLQRSKINSPHTRANSCRNFPGDRASSPGQVRAGNFLVPIAPHQNDDVAGLSVSDLADIDHHQIHRHTAENGATLPANQNSGVAIRKVPWISVGVTSCQRRDPHFPRSDEGAAIANGTSLRHVAHQTNAGFPCHHRFEEVLKFRKWRNPVKHDPGAHHVEGAHMSSEAKHACALEHMRFIIDWNHGAKLLRDFAKARKLIACVVRILTRYWQMSRNAVNSDIRKCGDLLENVRGFAFRNSHAAHPRINLEIDGYWRAVRYPIEIFCFLERRNCGNETALSDRRSFSRQSWSKNDDR